MPRRDTRVISAAIASNAAVTIAKFAAAAIGGSSSMLAEALHSLAETIDGVMHIVGERRAKRPPDERHPFGHGKELYFWTLVVALSIFAIGGCVSILEGVHRILHPKPIEHLRLSIGVLALAAIVQGASVGYAWWQLVRSAKRHGSQVTARPIKQETTKFVVAFEDTAGVIGVLIALAATVLGYWLEQPWIDGVGAILIGVLLGTVGVFLSVNIRKLLVGERVALEDMESLTKILTNEPSIRSVGRVRTMHFGPETVVLTANVHFDPKLAADDVAAASHRVVRAVQAEHPEVKYIFLHPISANGPDATI